MTNDEMRYEWYDQVIPKLKDLGLEVDAHRDEDERGGWYVGYQPDWDEVIQRFKNRGPHIDEYVKILRSGQNGLASA